MQGQVLITGAAGYIGRALCAGLAARGWQVIGACRLLPAQAPPPGGAWAEVGDLGADTPWDRHLQGVHAVVHAASPPPTDQPPQGDALERFRAVNLHGTRRLAQAAARAGVRHLIYLSSLKVHGESSGRPWTRMRPPRRRLPTPCPNWRRRRPCRRRLRAAACGSPGCALPWCTDRAAADSSAGCSGCAIPGCPCPWAPCPEGASFLYLDNLIHAVLACLDRPEAAHGAFLLADDRAWALPELLRHLCIALGPDRVFACPTPVLAGAARLLGAGEAVRPPAPLP